ncbi:MAG: NAD(P)/FAD-dependent oxidoreductase [Pseudomonadota bacterium]
MRQVDVAVVGAGPVGTVAAAALLQRGISAAVFEAGKAVASDLRASTFHPPTLEMLETLGIIDDMLAYGLKAPVYHLRERSTGDTVAFDMGELAGDTRFPFRLQCEQHVMSGMLAERIAAQPEPVISFEHRVVAFEQDETGVTLALETPVAIEKVRARYVIAADGGNSITRKWLGATFDGFTYPEKFLCLSTERDLAGDIPGLAYVNYVSDPEEWLVLLRTPNVWRVLVPVDATSDDALLLADSTRDDVFARLIGEPQVPTTHRTIYRVHQRVVERFCHDRICLVGDAAHLNNPLGGFGMNSGIHDVWSLVDVLAGALDGGHDADALAHWDRQRHAVTHAFIQAQSMQNKRFIEQGAAAGHAARFEAMRATRDDPDERRAYLLRQSMIQSLRDAADVA